MDNFLRQWRERPTDDHPDGMSQGDLAAASGVALSSISAYERGTANPSVEALRKLGAALNIPGGMILDVDPTRDTTLWEAFSQADNNQREAIGRMAAGLVLGAKAPRK